MLTDLDLNYALSLGLVFWMSEKITTAYRGFGIDLARFQGTDGWLLPIPATPESIGRDVPASSTRNFHYRMKMEDVMRAIHGG